ncbi:MAG: UDP-3-O-[3-hydroxymyristoyl] N-acetylglucosamine deacetylase [Nitrospinae bacterium]|nr:UDP-3-O-[3-hydroxymyristoyl] N-acetylglucosamine deacetylase [Nitrospinota bacterium]
MLIVDDEREILASLEDVLLDEGYRVERAESGEIALQLVRAEVPDVILVDVWMPGIDGIKTLQAVKESNADIEVVLMSGHGNIETAVAATKLGAFNFIEKPLSIDAVLRIVASAVQARRDKELRANDVIDVMLDGASKNIERARRAIRKAARDLNPLLIAGERGTGKRFIARVVHKNGVKKEEGFRPVHCRSLFPAAETSEWENTLERLVPETFQGTVYLDGLEQLPLAERERFLVRFLEHITDSMRLMVSLDHMGTPKDKALVRTLSSKIGADVMHLPPLRERKEDILPLANRFLNECVEVGRHEKEFSEDVIVVLEDYDWPGNIAELKGAVTKAAFASQGSEIRVDHLPYAIREASDFEVSASRNDTPSNFNVARTQWERQYLAFHLEEHGWDINKTAQAVGMTEPALRRKIKAYNIEPVLPASTTLRETNQRSISKSVVLYGRGLHSGLKTGLIIEPLPPGSGIQFGNLTSPDTVRASADFVDGTNHATNLRNGAVTARTIEHLMSALHAYKISNILIKMSEEVPVMDGSAVEFCRLLEEAGIEDQREKSEDLWVDKIYEVGEPNDEKGYVRIEPADSFSVSYLIDYPKPIGKQTYLYEHKNALGFQEEIAPARTFGFVYELESLEKMGLAEGGRWDNVILVDKARVVNTQLRFPNEFVRHKILDVIGDLYLTGRPIRGKVTAERSGHRHNVALVKKLMEVHG